MFDNLHEIGYTGLDVLMRGPMMDLEAMRSLEWREGVPGKVCAKCGHWKPLAGFNKKRRFVHSWCKECLREAYRAAPKKDKRAKYAAYNATHKDVRRAYREATKERAREYQRNYRRANPERRKEAQRRWSAKNKEFAREAHRRWRQTNPEKAFQNTRRRRLREINAEGRFSLAEWQALKALYNDICLACGRREPEVKLEADHVVPLAKGGSNYIDNIQPLCETCNKRKGTKVIDYRLRNGERSE